MSLSYITTLSTQIYLSFVLAYINGRISEDSHRFTLHECTIADSIPLYFPQSHYFPNIIDCQLAQAERIELD